MFIHCKSIYGTCNVLVMFYIEGETDMIKNLNMKSHTTGKTEKFRFNI